MVVFKDSKALCFTGALSIDDCGMQLISLYPTVESVIISDLQN